MRENAAHTGKARQIASESNSEKTNQSSSRRDQVAVYMDLIISGIKTLFGAGNQRWWLYKFFIRSDE
jgi:hypothetical protein